MLSIYEFKDLDSSIRDEASGIATFPPPPCHDMVGGLNYVNLISKRMQRGSYDIALAIKLLECSNRFSRNLRLGSLFDVIFVNAGKKVF